MQNSFTVLFSNKLINFDKPLYHFLRINLVRQILAPVPPKASSIYHRLAFSQDIFQATNFSSQEPRQDIPEPFANLFHQKIGSV
jgi:hypothetical protein